MGNGTIRVETVSVGMLQTGCHIVSRAGSDECVVVDPGDEAGRILSAVGKRKIAAVLLTHGHFDHIRATDDIMQEGSVLYIHQADAAMLRDPMENVSWMIRRQITVETAPVTVHEGDIIDAAGLQFQVLHTPGHTRGSCCYLAEDVLLTGDTLFHEGGYGRTDLPGGSGADMQRSLDRLWKITPGKRIYPGHG